MKDELIGQVIGRYRIEALLGRGGQAKVYKAYHPALDTYVAVKVLPQYFASEEGFVERFKQEARVIARLRHGGADTGSTAFAEAERQRESGQTEDAYLLYFFAAKQGSAEAALALGTLADPAYFVPQGGVLDLADPGQAYKWYRMAADNGNREAERRLGALLDWAKNSAAAGDEQAHRLMLQWRHRE